MSCSKRSGPVVRLVAVADVRVKCRRSQRIYTKAALSALFRLFVWLDMGTEKNARKPTNLEPLLNLNSFNTNTGAFYV